MSATSLTRTAMLAAAALSCPGISDAVSVHVHTQASWPNECIGYYTLALPGPFDYALVNVPIPVMEDIRQRQNFFGFGPSVAIGAWHSTISIDTTEKSVKDYRQKDIYITTEATEQDLNDLQDSYNKIQLHEKEELLGRANRLDNHQFSRDIDPDGSNKLEYLDRASTIKLYDQVPKRPAFGMVRSVSPYNNNYTASEEWLDFHILISNHVVGAIRKLDGSPQQTIDYFLSHYKARSTFEVPSQPGACVPYGFVTGEKEPAHIALSMRLKGKPDIVVFLDAEDASNGTKDPKEFLKRHIDLDYFYVSTRADPLDGRLKPFSVIQIDEQLGLGEFVSVKREDKTRMSPPVDNPADGGRDFGYLAYIPGKPGESFNLIFKVERFGRFAREPMTEKEFRELVAALAAGIHRRPGAWVPH